MNTERRKLIGLGAVATGALVLGACGRKEVEREANAVLPVEDLMREHGVLRRVLIVYDACVLRLETGQDLSPDALTRAADIVRRFVEDYHERNEEEQIFPRFERAHAQEPLVRVLREQHQVGRRLTDAIAATTARTFKDESASNRLVSTIRQFRHMYEAHAAREDTVLFPDVRKIVSPSEYDALGEAFEDDERKRFGEGGFGQIVAQVAAIERDLGIYDLATATPS
ncbi:MAG TPA: hemerythrin domain-containing protein [Polyangiaceae bacterium]|jgi:hemerythrin-like domain-containing protein|nr:hemerythrin domain-containing protein [Polyangiaceae bacterium]